MNNEEKNLIQEDESMMGLPAAFFELSDLEKNIAQLLSILWEAMTPAAVARCLKNMDIQGLERHWYQDKNLSHVMEGLVKNNILSHPNYSDFYFCCPVVSCAAITQSAIDDGQFHKMVLVIREEFPAIDPQSHRVNAPILHSYIRGVREIRMGLFGRDYAHAESFLGFCEKQFPEDYRKKSPLLQLCATPFRPIWFRKLPLGLQHKALLEMVNKAMAGLEPVDEYLEVLYEYKDFSDEHFGIFFRNLLVPVLLLRGDLSQVQRMFASENPTYLAPQFRGWLAFMQGDYPLAVHIFGEALFLMRTVSKKRNLYFTDMSGILYVLALLKHGEGESLAKAVEYIDIAEKQKYNRFRPVYIYLKAVAMAQKNYREQALSLLGFREEVTSSNVINLYDEMDGRLRYSTKEGGQTFWPASKHHGNGNDLSEFFRILALFWVDADVAAKIWVDVEKIYNKSQANGYLWVTMESASLLSQDSVQTPNQTLFSSKLATLQEQIGLVSLVSSIKKMTSWERALNALLALTEEKASSEFSSTSRLVWTIQIQGSSGAIRPREQTKGVRGGWTKGKPIALKRFYKNTHQVDFLTDQDRQICRAIRQDFAARGTLYELDWDVAMRALVGHPLVFWEDEPTVNVEVVLGEPELLLKRYKGNVRIQFGQDIPEHNIIAVRETPTRCKLIEITPQHRRIAEIIGKKGLQVPKIGTERVLQAVTRLASVVTVQSAIGGQLDNIDEVPADSKPYIHLLPYAGGLKVRMLVRPFAPAGPYFNPGRGGKTIITKVDEKRLQVQRDFKEERLHANAILLACPTLAGSEETSGEWAFTDPEPCLELLMELEEVGDAVVVEWPEGEKLRVVQKINMDNMRVKIQKDRDWFALSGELQLNESLVLEINQLLAMRQNTSGRFIPLGDGQFIALTETFRKRLDEIAAFSEESDGGRRFHALAAPLLRDIAENAGEFQADKHWKEHVNRMDQAQALDPEVPAMLKAELRDYQEVGFKWLARLAEWGVGACLADDMGLGKTLQALAVILYRASNGPTLVLAPTSVCMNWQSEIAQFAPTLNGILFGGEPQQRQEVLAELKPYDVLIVSYSLLQIEETMLAPVVWQTIVLDEAQAIKNRLTKRSKSAMVLNGGFKMITTGTPIENHLGELWNLFRFLNPGLLGSLEAFNGRFAIPIERDHDKLALNRLKSLIQPFILRRTKNQVMAELPARTEIVLHVEMSPEEMAFYETLRRRAVAEIESLEGVPAQNHLLILAQIMKLRRACCHSRLVLADSPIPSTKLELFWEVTADLLENNHKALVFSQFVDHLAIIRELLDEKGVHYQYLDGSTPAKQRKVRIEAFQAGTGDLFLISLKAGGVGINLTAADYVIHMDPWWNPAVEDQASNRAHRIGQNRPVTVYRLVSKHTIEEKIVDLHAQKRDLADGLLAGGEMSGKMTAEKLLELIRSQA